MMAAVAADLSIVHAVVVIQAHVRSFLARRKLLEVRKEFEEVLKELERKSRFVHWKREGFGLPLIISDSEVLNDTNGETNLVSREISDETERNRGLVKRGFGDTRANGEAVCTTTVQNECSSDTRMYCSRVRNLNVSELHVEQVDGERSTDFEHSLPERTSNTGLEGYDNGELQQMQNQGFLLENGNKSKQGKNKKDETTSPWEQSPEKLASLGVNDGQTQCDCQDDKCPHKISEFSCSAFPLSSTLKHTSSNEPEMKETVGYHSSSETSLQGYVHSRLHLRDQAHLSDSWMSDRSFDPVVSAETPAVTDLPSDTVKLRELRDHIAMELLWTEQAIQSRKKAGMITLGEKMSDIARCFNETNLNFIRKAVLHKLITSPNEIKYLGLRKGLAQADHDIGSAQADHSSG